METYEKLFSIFKSVVFPKRCCFCSDFIYEHENICEVCSENLPWITGKICVLCGKEKADCICKKAARKYDVLAAPLYYRDMARRGISLFKFYNKPHAAPQIGAVMYDTLEERFSRIAFDMITYVPLGKRGIKERGYNQAKLLAGVVSSFSGIPVSDTLVKLYETTPQHELGAASRKGNVLGIFDVTCPEGIEDKTVLLIDDVCTTGATLNECAKMLMLYGARRVFCLTAAIVCHDGDDADIPVDE